MQVNPSEDLFCCTKKGTAEKKNSIEKNTQNISMFSIQSSLFNVL